ncbi:MAG TPA: protein translocase subunit SecF [Actinomycetota bacterium]|nr:protein translocase subunit SecF [Actinomycetota bacterium]
MRVRHFIETFRGHVSPNLNIIGRWRWWFLLSGFVIALALVGLFGRGLNFSIAFTGGSLLQFPNRSGASVAQYQQLMARHGLPQAQVEVLGDNEVSIRTESLSELGTGAAAERPAVNPDRLRQDLARLADITGAEINEQDVGPTWGRTISQKMITGLVVFLALVTLYITLRFEWKMAIGALAALAHDGIITAGTYALVGREITPETVIAILTILGYSMYDTVVIYDKVKENTESAALIAREGYSNVVNMSLNQVLMRSLNTSVSTLLPIGALLLFGGETLKDFAFALFIGLTTGAYSSIFVASPLLALLKEREPRYRQIRARAMARQARPGLRAVPAGKDLRVDDGEAERELEPAGAVAARPQRASGSQARPRTGGSKKKKTKAHGKPKRRRR